MKPNISYKQRIVILAHIIILLEVVLTSFCFEIDEWLLAIGDANQTIVDFDLVYSKKQLKYISHFIMEF